MKALRNFVRMIIPLLIATKLSAAGAQERAKVDPIVLSQAIAERVARVQEFGVIRQMAEERGLRVWLFGGTAATLAHYVKWDLLRESGSTRYPASRFDYDFTNVFRSTQDIDIVIDGKAHQVREFQAAIQARFPYFMGSKGTGTDKVAVDQWEVRSLKHDVGDKEALLNNPNFRLQHTDSNSIGLIELTDAGEPRVRDLRDWAANEARFLKDVAHGHLRYYHSDKHHTTTRARMGMNPPVFSVIRYFIKAFQFELQIRPDDLSLLQRLIDKFDPALAKEGYVQRWIEKNVPKLFQHAVSVEYASEVLDKTGLKRKLLEISDPTKIGSAAWWLNKEPLKAAPVGQGTGKTIRELAKDLGIPLKQFIVAHETGDFLAYESLTRNVQGMPNVFISRANAPGEKAIYGNGHYTLIGRKGTRQTGLNVRYRPHPDAREGTDYLREGNILIWLNRAALEVIEERMSLDILEYFQMLAEGRLFGEEDRGIKEQLRRRLNNQSLGLSAEREAALVGLIRTRMSDAEQVNRTLLREWFETPVSARYPDIVERLITSPEWRPFVARNALTQPHWAEHTGLMERFLESGQLNNVLIQSVLPHDHWASHPEFVERLINLEVYDYHIIRHILPQPHWAAHPHLVELLLERGGVDIEIVRYLLPLPWWSHRTDWIETILARKTADSELITRVLSQPHVKVRMEWVQTLIARKANVDALMMSVLRRPEWANHPEIVEDLLKAYPELHVIAAEYVLPQVEWTHHPELLEIILKDPAVVQIAVAGIFEEEHWVRAHPHLISKILTMPIKSPMLRRAVDAAVVAHVFELSAALEHAEWIELLLARGNVDDKIAWHVLQHPQWQDKSEWFERLLKKGTVDEYLARHALPQEFWTRHPEFLEVLVRRGNANHYIEREVLKHPHWLEHPRLREALKGKVPTLSRLRTLFENGFSFMPKGRCEALLKGDPT